MIFIALGANLPGPDGTPPKTTLLQSLAALEARGGRVVRRSRWYRSDAVPPSGQPPFVNGVAEIDTTLAPDALLRVLHEIEAAQGRVRTVPNAARRCDLDLLDYHGRIMAPENGGPVLPHPRLAERLFVLLPLQELAPDWVHPVSGIGIRALIAAVPPGQRCAPLTDRPATS